MLVTLNGIRSRINSKQKELLWQSGIAFAVRLLGALAGFMLSLVIARTLSPEQAGYYFFAFSVVVVLGSVGEMGLTHSFLRFIGASKGDRNWAQASSVFKKGIGWSFISACSMAVLLWLAAPWLSSHIMGKPDVGPVLQVMAPGVVFFALFTLNGHALQALGKVAKAVFTLNVGVPVTLTVVLLMGAGTDAKTTAVWYSIAALGMTALSFIWWLRSPGIQWWGVEKFPAATLWQSCFPLWTVAIFGQAVQWSGQLISGAYVASEEIAMLAVAQRTAMLTSFILMAVNLVVAPKFAALYKQGKNDELQSIAIFATRLMVLFALPVVGFMLLFPEWLMWLFGEEYKAGANLLRILAIGQFINVITGSVGFLLTMSGHERDMRNVVLFSGPLAIILALLLTPLYGVTGATVATAISVASQNLLAVAMVRKRLGFNTLAIWR